MRRKALLYLLIAQAVGCTAHPQNARNSEQRHFSMEQEIVPVRRPVNVPPEVLEILRRDELATRSGDARRPPSEIPATWFVGSEIHLNGPNEIDLVVLPRLLETVPAENAHLFGANVARFWVFRKTPTGYNLVFAESVHDLEVLLSRTKGYRDLRTTSATAVSVTILLFRFNGVKYDLYKKVTKPEDKTSPG